MKPITPTDSVLLIVHDEADQEIAQAICKTVAEAKFLGYKAIEQGGSFRVMDVVYNSKYQDY